MARMGGDTHGIFTGAYQTMHPDLGRRPTIAPRTLPGYTNQGVAVIAVAQEHRTAQGFCYSALSTVVFISKQDGTRTVVNEELIAFHSRSFP